MKTRHAATPGAQGGFSLMELLVAVTVTMLISGAIFTLMQIGQQTARREPALQDRTQNMRAALMLIEKDALAAGQDLFSFVQIFGDNLNGVGPMGPDGVASDFLQIVGSDARCPSLDVCSPGRSGGTGVSITTMQSLPACMSLPGLVMLANDTEWGIFWACPPGNGANSSCAGQAGGASNGHAILPPRVREFNPPGGPDFTPTKMTGIQVTRYEIRVDAEGIPNLWRSATGGVASASAGCGNGTGDATGGWQMVARGIEDLQVQYRNGAGAWADTPGTIVTEDYNSLIRQLRITLTARTTINTHLHGESQPAGAARAVRGRVTTTVTPRAVLATLANADPEPLWR